MKKVHFKQPNEQADDSYFQTKEALEFLYQQSLINNSPELSAILKKSIQNCEELIEGDVIHLGDAADAIYCIKFIRAFMLLDTESKKSVFEILLLQESH